MLGRDVRTHLRLQLLIPRYDGFVDTFRQIQSSSHIGQLVPQLIVSPRRLSFIIHLLHRKQIA